MSKWFQTRRFLWEFPIGWEIHITILSGASSSIRTKLWWNSHWMILFQNCVRQSRSPTKMAANDYFIKVWFQTRRFLCEFPIGSYVKLSSAVEAILVEGPNRRIHFWKRTIQWLFHQNLVLNEQMVSDKKIFMRILCPNLNCISIMMSFLTYIIGFFMNFELLPILTDYAN
jgi:hypothetical protein